MATRDERESTGLGRWLHAAGMVAVVAVLLTMSTPVAAQDDDPEYQIFDKVNVALGFGWARFDTTVRMDSKRFPNLGTEIRFEKDLGLSAGETIPGIEVEWMMARRHMLSLYYTKTGRDASRQVSTEIQFGDIVIPIEERVEASFDQQVIGIGYTFWPVQRPRYAFGFGIGARVMKLTATLEARDLEITEEADVTAPLPFLDVQFRYGITPRTRLTSDFGVFQANIGDYDGLQALIAVRVEHLTWSHFGFGGGFNWQKVNVKTDQEEFTGKAKMESLYFSVFGRARW